MREQGHAVLPPTERRKASFNLGKREDGRQPIMHISRESRKWMIFEGKTTETPGGPPPITRDQKLEKKMIAFHSPLLKMTEENMKEEKVVVAETLEINCPEGDLGKNRMCSKASPSREGVGLLQWGDRKRPRCSRVENHLKHNSVTEESSVLSRKTFRVKAEKISVASGVSGTVACKGSVKGTNEVVTGRERSRLPPILPDKHIGGVEDGRKRAKILRGGAPELVNGHRGAPAESGRGAQLHTPLHTEKKNPHVSYLSKTRTSPDHVIASPDRTATAHIGGIEIATAKIEFDWPKIFMSLSRKEKEDDFLIIKGTKLPQRPKRRPKAVEKALLFCTPGNWLTDLSRGRYEVREKKCAKKKPKGLKAMDSMESDSE